MNNQARMSVQERYEYGKSLRKQAPLEGHAEWAPGPSRPDPVTLLEQQNQQRVSWLVPVRRARMSASPFTFYRGTARIMASDLASTPVSSLQCQICGDAHIANFGAYASPERNLVVDLNDFDETLPGPWEWDIKRLTVSVFIACRHNGLSKKETHHVTERCARTYRKSMSAFARMRLTEIWYSKLEMQQVLRSVKHKKTRKSFDEIFSKAMTKDSLHALDRLAEEVCGEYRIRSEPPLLIPFRELTGKRRTFSKLKDALEGFRDYLISLPDDCAHLVSQYDPVDFALKVVGVGSVGTRCYVMLLEGRDRRDPLFLQIKQAVPSVLEEFLPASRYDNAGERVIQGQRMMQTVSDIFLGHSDDEKTGYHYYWRQLRDWKGTADIDNATHKKLYELAKIRGWTLARAHARSGDPVAISGYLGKSKAFDHAIVAFSEKYAKQAKQDYLAFMDKIQSGRLEVAKLDK